MKPHNCLLAALAIASCFPLTALAEDMLIAREAGIWKLVGKGAPGRVEKTAPNQEVLRRGENGRVLVMTLFDGDNEGRVMCSEKERRDFRSPCASAFLDCTPDGGGLLRVMLGAIMGGIEGASAQRNRHSCRIDENAILQAALSVGMINRILPKSAQ